MIVTVGKCRYSEVVISSGLTVLGLAISKSTPFLGAYKRPQRDCVFSSKLPHLKANRGLVIRKIKAGIFPDIEIPL